MDRSIGGAETSAHLQTAPQHNLAIAMGSLLVLMPASGVVAIPVTRVSIWREGMIFSLLSFFICERESAQMQ